MHENPVASGMITEAQYYKYSSAVDYYEERRGLVPILFMFAVLRSGDLGLQDGFKWSFRTLKPEGTGSAAKKTNKETNPYEQ